MFLNKLIFFCTTFHNLSHAPNYKLFKDKQAEAELGQGQAKLGQELDKAGKLV